MKTNSCFELELMKNERTYRLLLPVGAPLGEIYDVLLEMTGEVVSIINQQVEKNKPKPTETSDKIVKMDA